MADRINVVAMKSTAMSVPGVMAERAEVLVTETIASGLITEGILPTIEHAHEYLLTPDATIIPAAASVMGYLTGGPLLEDMLFVGKIAGFGIQRFRATYAGRRARQSAASRALRRYRADALRS
jgi:hypothetical protein